MPLAYTVVLVVGVFSLAGDRRVFYLGVGLAVIGLAAGVGYLTTETAAMRGLGSVRSRVTVERRLAR